ncbi:rifin [Plasmodium falciparum NF54]|uniref:Rifin n=2 Tax=Plasmodium falciparum TaxID=5833 RepID=Q8IK40_PLAF7|nr:rifin [Plasmodium falciparum 3D7]EWC85263.1 hypothetical protein PFNF54_05939 [Plasmodium falciparum NF54]KAF4330827.1 rifin [Plasmodium falciparum NF54]PKC49654.1 rifin [Plasmodium falciparum NF54]CZU00493.1 rifin [Plasmodium falciparum 3D7]|eukprot:XP_001348943.1 rifin [Plasmodium falciparum 3D7]
MKLNYTKILLFFFPLNILVTSYHGNNNNKTYVTSHIPTNTSRLLSEKDLQSSIYDNDPDMKSVKENFDRQTSQRFEEYEERMIPQRQKYNEQRDKDIQKIILKDKMEKSLEEKVEKGCLRCGFGLGGVAAGVGIFGSIAVNELKKAAIAKAVVVAKEAAEKAGAAAAAEAGKNAVIAGLEEMGISTLRGNVFETLFTANTYPNASEIALAINEQYNPSSCILPIGGSGPSETFCTWVKVKSDAAPKIPGKVSSTYEVIETAVKSIVTDAKTVAETAAKKATEEAIKASTDAVESAYAACQTAIIASVVAILVIVLVMMIIYLILRYRRKKKMNKKLQYTKLLNQ